MNHHLRSPFPPRPKPGTTQAADGMPRRKWSGAEIQRMIDAGIVEHGERFELIGGELIAMAAKGARHERIKIELNAYWNSIRPKDVMVGPETPLRLGDYDEPEPEFMVYPRAIKPEDVRADTVLLVVEVAETSLKYDLGFKARLYASFGVREYWVINAQTLETTIFRSPDPLAASFRSRNTFGATDTLTPELVPSLAVRLCDLEFD